MDNSEKDINSICNQSTSVKLSMAIQRIASQLVIYDPIILKSNEKTKELQEIVKKFDINGKINIESCGTFDSFKSKISACSKESINVLLCLDRQDQRIDDICNISNISKVYIYDRNENKDWPEEKQVNLKVKLITRVISQLYEQIENDLRDDYLKISVIHKQLGEYGPAVNILAQCLAIYPRPDQNTNISKENIKKIIIALLEDISESIIEIGLIHLRKNEYDGALGKFKESSMIYKEVLANKSSNIKIANCYKYIADCYLSQNKYKDSFDNIKEALKLLIPSDNNLESYLKSKYYFQGKEEDMKSIIGKVTLNILFTIEKFSIIAEKLSINTEKLAHSQNIISSIPSDMYDKLISSYSDIIDIMEKINQSDLKGNFKEIKDIIGKLQTKIKTQSSISKISNSNALRYIIKEIYIKLTTNSPDLLNPQLNMRNTIINILCIKASEFIDKHKFHLIVKYYQTIMMIIELISDDKPSYSKIKNNFDQISQKYYREEDESLSEQTNNEIAINNHKELIARLEPEKIENIKYHDDLYFHIGLVYLYILQDEKAIEYFTKASIFCHIDDEEKKTEYYTYIADSYHNLGKNDEAIEYYSKALNFYEKLPKKYIINIFKLCELINKKYLITIYGHHEQKLSRKTKNYYEKFMDNYQRFLELCDEEIGIADTKAIFDKASLNFPEKIIEIYRTYRIFFEFISSKPKDTQSQALSSSRKILDQDTYNKTMDYLNYFLQKLQKAIKDTNSIRLCSLELALSYSTIQKYHSGIEVLSILPKYDNYSPEKTNLTFDEKALVGEIYLYLAYLYYELKNFSRALEYNSAALSVFRSIPNTSDIIMSIKDKISQLKDYLNSLKH